METRDDWRREIHDWQVEYDEDDKNHLSDKKLEVLLLWPKNKLKSVFKKANFIHIFKIFN